MPEYKWLIYNDKNKSFSFSVFQAGTVLNGWEEKRPQQ
jgi:hypothetical protein